jgi:hypothetical protein
MTRKSTPIQAAQKDPIDFQAILLARQSQGFVGLGKVGADTDYKTGDFLEIQL